MAMFDQYTQLAYEEDDYSAYEDDLHFIAGLTPTAGDWEDPVDWVGTDKQWAIYEELYEVENDMEKLNKLFKKYDL